MSEALAKMNRLMTYAENVAVEGKERLLEDGVSPLLIAGAMAQHGVISVLIEELEVNERLMIIDMLEEFIEDQKSLIGIA